MRRIVLFAAAVMLAVAGVVQAEGAGTASADPATEGQLIFEQKCTACHTVGGGVRIGPDLQGVTTRRPHEWLAQFIANPDQFIAAKDPTVMALLEQYNRIPMPNLALTADEVQKLLAYLGTMAQAPGGAASPAAPSAVALPQPPLASPQSAILAVFLLFTGVIAVIFLWIGRSTRSPATVDVKRAYGVRRVLFIVGTVSAVALLVVTIPHAPYARAGARADRVVYVAARQYDFIFSDEPITNSADLAQVARIQSLEIPAGTQVEFRVTSLDVNHGFGLYGPERQIVAQTQAMPGYFNRLLVRFDEPAQYRVFCLEYCAAGHHLMQAHLSVK